jgi:cytochrome oxidase Cu insertion factor (SCO1/SenC/PrrC family)
VTLVWTVIAAVAPSSSFAAAANRVVPLQQRRVARAAQAPIPWSLDDDNLLGSIPENRTFVPLLQVGDAVPDEPLLDQSGRRLSLLRAAGISIVSFTYTRCPDESACPLVTAKFARLQHLLRGTTVRLVELTLDAPYDRPSVLAAYARVAGARSAAVWAIGTGRPSVLFGLSQRFGIVRSRSASGAFTHTNVVAIVSPSGRVETLIPGDDWSPDDLAAQARVASRLPSDPLRVFALALFARVGAACGSGNGSTGVSLLGALTIFISLTLSIAFLVVRLFHAGFSR